MLILRTGLPGASKTLNTLREICHESNYSDRPVYYNNIKLVMLDFEVCNSFAGWFYGVYFPLIDKNKKPKYQKLLSKIHADDELASLEHFPHLRVAFDNWVIQKGFVDLWLYWVKRCYPKKLSKSLDDYISLLDEKPTFEELSTFNLDWRHFHDPLTWHTLPRGSVIVVDECQQWFPPRPVGSKRPQHVSEFETHRHKGFDVHLITQDAKLLDSDVRRLTGRHVNYFNPFGSNRVARYEADKVFDPSNYHDKQASVRTLIKRDKNFYGLYWSADFHTHKLRLPKKLLILPVLLVLIASLLIYVFNGGLPGSSSGEVSSSPEPTQSQPVPGIINQVNSVSQFPILSGAQFSLGNHPLAQICNVLHFAGKEVIGRTRRFHVRCIQRVGDDEEAEHYFDTRYLYELGYNVSYQSGFLRVEYFENVFLLNGF